MGLKKWGWVERDALFGRSAAGGPAPQRHDWQHLPCVGYAAIVERKADVPRQLPVKLPWRPALSCRPSRAWLQEFRTPAGREFAKEFSPALNNIINFLVSRSALRRMRGIARGHSRLQCSPGQH